MELNVYCYIDQGNWKAVIPSIDGISYTLEIDGKEIDENPYRMELMSVLEILQFLRKWYHGYQFKLIVNSQYIISCFKWIPQWVQKSFRIGYINKLRPHSDLLVKVHSFQSHLSCSCVQHYTDYESYHHYIKS